MLNLLHLDSSAGSVERSRSRAIGRTFSEAWLKAAVGNTVTHRDLHRDPLPHLADDSLHWPPRLRHAEAAPPADAEALQASLIAELLAADVLLVGAPLYNYSLPSSLKAWIDNIHVPGVTAPFDGDTQPLAGRPAVIVTSRGASYDAGSPTEGWDHEVPALRLVLGTALGMEITVIETNLTLAGDVPALAPQLPRSEAELAAAHAEAAAQAARLGAPRPA
ncbi:NAD(P)H-dependent oxidoreductase [Herbiconiux sp.]|uniref:FMN-dependent NADH-azoreductase n=1 Tax=Herbiconiux sp. TaxID=1871186 RepID=UPI0025BECB36|nr:NAD(P)H-dependent oxidoreductase [Herbiconiux sp.]